MNTLKSLSSLAVCTLLLSSCGVKSDPQEPKQKSAVIDSKSEDCAVLAREFGVDCETFKPLETPPDAQPAPEPAKPVAQQPTPRPAPPVSIPRPETRPTAKPPQNTAPQAPEKKSISTKAANEQKQQEVNQKYPLQFSSNGMAFPLRGSWRKTKMQIEDVILRKIWSPEQQKVIDLTDEFELILLVNVADRTPYMSESHSAQRMQVLFKSKNPSSGQTEWEILQVWPISSGKPDGYKRISTFTGVFKFDPERIFSEYRSKQFEDANMFETMFLYHFYQNGEGSGVAIHGTTLYKRLGRRDSGGCIRLARENARCLYNTIRSDVYDNCLGINKNSLWGMVPSLYKKTSEMEPEYLSNGQLNVGGYRVMIGIFDDPNDML